MTTIDRLINLLLIGTEECAHLVDELPAGAHRDRAMGWLAQIRELREAAKFTAGELAELPPPHRGVAK